MKQICLLTMAFTMLLLNSCTSSKGIRLLAENESDIQRLINEAEAGTTIQLKNKTYNIQDMLDISDKKNLTIDGRGAKLIINSLQADVIAIRNSENITLKNLMAKHIEPSGPLGCTGNVVSISESKSIVIDNCELNGSGLVGVAAYFSDVLIKNSHLHKNSEYAVIFQGKKLTMLNNKIENNGHNNAILFDHITSMNDYSWPPKNEIKADENMDGLEMKGNKFGQ